MVCGVQEGAGCTTGGRTERNSKPTLRHFELAQQVLKYLVHTKEKGLKFWKGGLNDGKTQITCYCDANYARETKAKSASGWVIKLGKSVVDFGTKRQQHTARSTFESEFIALSGGVEKVIFFGQILEFLGVKQVGPPQVFCDNISTIEAYDQLSICQTCVLEVGHQAGSRLKSGELG